MVYQIPLYSMTVLYRNADSLPADPPLAFVCDAEDSEHAEEQCKNAYPNCIVVWIALECETVEEALVDYYDAQSILI